MLLLGTYYNTPSPADTHNYLHVATHHVNVYTIHVALIHEQDFSSTVHMAFCDYITNSVYNCYIRMHNNIFTVVHVQVRSIEMYGLNVHACRWS